MHMPLKIRQIGSSFLLHGMETKLTKCIFFKAFVDFFGGYVILYLKKLQFSERMSKL